MDFNKAIKWIIAIIVISLLSYLYGTYNPNGNIYFPHCPFNELTGLKCSGCGSQRAAHYLLNFEILKALKENVLFVMAIPYIVTGLSFDLVKKPTKNILKWRKILFGRKSIFIILFIIIGFGILRNIKF